MEGAEYNGLHRRTAKQELITQNNCVITCSILYPLYVQLLGYSYIYITHTELLFIKLAARF